MRVLNLIGGISRNAPEQTARRLEHYFSGHEVTCGIFESSNDGFESIAKNRGIKTEFLGDSVTYKYKPISPIPGRGYSSAVHHALQSRGQYDLIHVYGAPHINGPAGVLYAIANQAPLITRFNGYVPLPEAQPKRALYQVIMKKLLNSSRIVFNSYSQKRDILSTFNAEKKKNVEVIPPGIDIKSFNYDSQNSTLYEEIGVRKSTNIIGSVLTPRPVKQLDKAFQIISNLKEDFDITYIVVGDSEYLPEYKNLAKNMGISKHIYWAGYQEQNQLSKWYSLFDITILTSKWESFGMSLSESYLCRTPCVAFDIGGMSDQIEDGLTGFLIEPYDTDSFAEAIQELLTDSEKLTNFGRRGQKFVSQNFSLEKASTQYQDMIKSL